MLKRISIMAALALACAVGSSGRSASAADNGGGGPGGGTGNSCKRCEIHSSPVGLSGAWISYGECKQGWLPSGPKVCVPAGPSCNMSGSGWCQPMPGDTPPVIQ